MCRQAGKTVVCSRYRLAREKRTVGELGLSPWEGSGGTAVVTRAQEKQRETGMDEEELEIKRVSSLQARTTGAGLFSLGNQGARR